MARQCERRNHLIRPSIKELRRNAASVVEGRVQRLTLAGRWVEDDGVSPGLAFTAGVIAYYPGPACACFGSERCLARIATRHVSAHYPYGSGNGRQVVRYVRR
jgi:hypothetical protein